jgi:hypothetical protein
VVQEFVRPATGHPASVRVVTVRGRVIAAAVFYAADGFVSNAGAGGRILPLSGRNRDCRLGPMERRVLEALGINATSRELPGDAQDAVTRASDWLGTRGVQICGHDLLCASDGRWLYIESNAFPGYRVFSATDGDGSRDLLKSYRLAGEILADAIAAAFET